MSKAKSFEENLIELEALVLSLEKGDVPLEEAIATFEKGMKLSKGLETSLKSAEEKLAKIMKDEQEVLFDGNDGANV